MYKVFDTINIHICFMNIDCDSSSFGRLPQTFVSMENQLAPEDESLSEIECVNISFVNRKEGGNVNE